MHALSCPHACKIAKKIVLFAIPYNSSNNRKNFGIINSDPSTLASLLDLFHHPLTQAKLAHFMHDSS